jgi:hypothetical protein
MIHYVLEGFVMITEIFAPISLYLAAAGLTALAWFKGPRLRLRFHHQRPNQHFRLLEISLVLFQAPRRRPSLLPQEPKGFELSTYITMKRCE